MSRFYRNDTTALQRTGLRCISPSERGHWMLMGGREDLKGKKCFFLVKHSCLRIWFLFKVVYVEGLIFFSTCIAFGISNTICFFSWKNMNFNLFFFVWVNQLKSILQKFSKIKNPDIMIKSTLQQNTHPLVPQPISCHFGGEFNENQVIQWSRIF